MYIIYKDYPIEGDNWYYLNNTSVNQINKELHIPTGSVNYLLSNVPINDVAFFDSYKLDWNLEKGSVSPLVIDIETAKEKFINDMRYARSVVFPNLDIEFIKTLELGNSTISISEKKQKLRDLPNMDLSDVNTITQLKSRWPTDLLGDSPYKN
jgi:hypothetical protein